MQRTGKGGLCKQNKWEAHYNVASVKKCPVPLDSLSPEAREENVGQLLSDICIRRRKDIVKSTGTHVCMKSGCLGPLEFFEIPFQICFYDMIE